MSQYFKIFKIQYGRHCRENYQWRPGGRPVPTLVDIVGICNGIVIYSYSKCFPKYNYVCELDF